MLVLVAVLTTTAVAIVTADDGRPGSPLGSPTGCGSAPVPPTNAEVNTVLDAKNGVLEYSFRDHATGEDRAARIEYRACKRPELQPLIAHVLAVEAKLRRDTCASMRETLASGATRVRGLEIDREAGARLLATEC